MPKSQPLTRYSFKSASSAPDVPGGVAEDEAPVTLSTGRDGTTPSESPARRAHRLRMKALLAATKPAG